MQFKMWFAETIQHINRWMMMIGWGVTLGVITGIGIYVVQLLHVVEVAEAHQEEVVVEKPEPRVVQIEVVYNWTPERIAQEINKVFPDAPIMHDVMRCESGGNNDAYNPTNGSHDNGLFQISDYYHGKEVRALGLDVGNPADNIKFARILYDRNGLSDWSASKYCWSK